MAALVRVWPSAAGLLYQLADPVPGRAGVVDVQFDGRRVWSFREPLRPAPAARRPPDLPAHVPDPGSLRFQEWPPALANRLRGRARVCVRLGGSAAEATVEFGGSPEPLRLVDAFQRPLVVNKWGRLGHAIADADPGMVGRMLDHMDDIRRLLEEHLGPVVQVTGGTLLGPVREQRLLPHDDDADLAYLSRFTHPVDVTLESFEVGRLLRAAGYDAVRLSVAHVQVQFDHDGVPDHYVDVFTGFLMDGWWMQPFPVRVRATRDQLLPAGTVLVEGREEPAPHDPEFVLQALYGEGWRTPDPSFTFAVPPETGDRFYGWFADYNVEREDWEEDLVLAPPRRDLADDETLSAFGRWVDERTPPGTGLVELGCGIGTDALALAQVGRAVRAVDFSRSAVAAASARAAGRDLDLHLRVLNLLDTRAVVRLGAELASAGSWAVFGRRLLDSLEDRGRANVFRLCSMLLRRGTAAHFDVVAPGAHDGIPGHRQLTVEQVVAEAERSGLVLVEALPVQEPLRWFGTAPKEIVPLHRLEFRRRTR